MWALTNFDNTLKDERYATYEEALDAFTGKFLLSSADIVEV